MNIKKITTVSVVGLLALATVKNLTSNKKADDESMASSAAMITNMKGNSGGTGVVLSSKNNESLILTNAHVCGVVKEGGIVTTDIKRAIVASYQVSKLHDLCMIKVKSNLHVDTEIATESPDIYSNATVSGHPALLPTVLTKGHFSDHEFITIITGFRECTEKDKEELDLLCRYFGVVPVIKNYESQVVSSTIMPGSSGSAVFNDKGQVAGLVFAGSGNLSYGHIVPQEFVQYFVEQEVKTLKEELPELNSVKLILEGKMKMKESCSSPTHEYYEIVKDYCDYIKIDVIKE